MRRSQLLFARFEDHPRGLEAIRTCICGCVPCREWSAGSCAQKKVEAGALHRHLNALQLPMQYSRLLLYKLVRICTASSHRRWLQLAFGGTLWQDRETVETRVSVPSHSPTGRCLEMDLQENQDLALSRHG